MYRNGILKDSRETQRLIALTNLTVGSPSWNVKWAITEIRKDLGTAPDTTHDTRTLPGAFTHLFFSRLVSIIFVCPSMNAIDSDDDFLDVISLDSTSTSDRSVSLETNTLKMESEDEDFRNNLELAIANSRADFQSEKANFLEWKEARQIKRAKKESFKSLWKEAARNNPYILSVDDSEVDSLEADREGGAAVDDSDNSTDERHDDGISNDDKKPVSKPKPRDGYDKAAEDRSYCMIQEEDEDQDSVVVVDAEKDDVAFGSKRRREKASKTVSVSTRKERDTKDSSKRTERKLGEAIDGIEREPVGKPSVNKK